MGVRITAHRLAVALAAAASGTALTVLVPASAVADHELTPVPCSPRAAACVDLSEDLSWLMEGGAVTYGPVWISHGAEGYETPPGVFRVSFKTGTTSAASTAPRCPTRCSSTTASPSTGAT